MPQKLSPQIISAAIVGFEHQKTLIDAQIAELRAMLSNDGTASNAATIGAPARKRRKLSAAARRKMALAQKARWAKLRGESKPAPAPAPKPKRKLSAARRAALIANLKKARRAKAAKAKAAKK